MISKRAILITVPKTMIHLQVIMVLFCVKRTLAMGLLSPKVHTPVGDIRGVRALSGNYVNFLGIPYGKVDEKNPFSTSKPYPKFKGTFKSVIGEIECPQISILLNTSLGHIDCLTLNVYVPDTAKPDNLLPVMVWLYGGSYEIGSAGRLIYGPKFIVRHNVILVTVNYRLGPYGFMCLDRPDIPGNQGLKDQLLSLRWVRDNIAAFNGDVNKITLFGESVGARSIDLHILSPQETLYHKLIMESGDSLVRNTIIEPDLKVLIKIAAQMGFHTEDTTKALDYLAKQNPKSVIEATAQAKLNLRPCVEKKFDNVETLITDYPQNLKPHKAKNMPILMGFNSMEQVARYLNKDSELRKHKDVIYDRLNEYFDLNEEELQDAVNEVRQFYFPDGIYSKGSIWKYIDFNSDFTYNFAIERGIKRFLEVGVPKLFHYVFYYNGDRNLYKNKENVKAGGVSHFDEIGYLYNVFGYPPPSASDQLIIDRMTTMWTNFAKYSDPTPDTTELLPVKWLPTTTTDY